MTQTDNSGFSIADWRVSPHEGLLSSGDRVVHLEPLAMAVLVYLARHHGEVVSREALERDVWQGAVVGYDAVTNTIIKLRKALQDDARQPRYIATVPKKGYQLIADINRAEPPSPVKQDPAPMPASAASGNKQSFWSRPPVMLFTLLAGMGLLLLLWFGFGTGSRPVQQAPSIVVLPFENLGDDPQQAYLADGITEDITTDLSRVSGIRVLASNTAERFKEKQIPEQIGEELAVKFVLKGSVRQLGGEIRVNAQLVDTATGYNVWAERYDRKVNEVFAVQDEVTQSIVSALALNLTSQEKQRLAKQATANLQAYDLFQEGQRLYKISTLETNQQALEVYRKAVEIDPLYGRAYGAMAVVLAINYRRDWTDTPNATLDRALQLAKKAVALDDSTPQTWWALGFVHLAQKDFAQAEQAAMKSIEVAPNYADGYGLLAVINSYAGNPEKAIAYNDKGIRLNPYYSHEYLVTYGLAYYTLADYTRAISILEQGYVRNPNHAVIKFLLCASYAAAGRQQEAEWLALELQSATPATTLGSIARSIPLARSDTLNALLGDLRTAGLPD
jgi:TolB-like protein/DNA-binding winged helix-turn-helix (wHTH) protein/cytochrome c-type biogenesis protein CcmH/NrfG